MTKRGSSAYGSNAPTFLNGGQSSSSSSGGGPLSKSFSNKCEVDMVYKSVYDKLETSQNFTVPSSWLWIKTKQFRKKCHWIWEQL